MDLSRSPRHRGSLLVVVGFVLLLNPLLVGHYDIGDPDHYRYEPREVVFHENGTADVPVGVGVVDPDLRCLDSVRRRSCALERAIHAEGGVTYDGPPGNFLRTEYDYVFVHGEGFYEPVAEELSNGTVRYDLRRAPLSAVIDRVSTPVEDAHPGVQRAIGSGSFETSDELPGANELVRTADGLYVVRSTTHSTRSGSERSTAVVALQWALGVLGGSLVLRGQRHRVLGR